MFAARKRLMRKPFSATSAAGATASRSDVVPQRCSAVSSAASVPGTPTARPLVDATVNSCAAGTPLSRNCVGVAAAGAFSRASIAKVRWCFARCTIMKPPPPMPENCGSTTLSMNWIAAAASIALPPRASTSAPAFAASGCDTDTTPLRNATPSQAGAAGTASVVSGSVMPGGAPGVLMSSCANAANELAAARASKDARKRPVNHCSVVELMVGVSCGWVLRCGVGACSAALRRN